MENLDPHPVDFRRNKGWRRNEAHARSHGVQKQDIGPRNTRMGNVAADCNIQTMQASLVAANGQSIKQGLSGMLVATVTGIQNCAIDLFAQKLDRTTVSMTDNKGIWVHGVQSHRRINKGFTLFDRTGAHRHIDDICTKAFSGQFERRQRSGRVLVKKINNCRTRQNVTGFVSGAVFFRIVLCAVQNKGDFPGGQAPRYRGGVGADNDPPLVP